MNLRCKMKYIYLLILGALAPLLFSSCVYENIEDEPGRNKELNAPKLIIRLKMVSPLDAAATQLKVKEQIKSLRIIILNDEFVQVNEKVNFPPGVDAATFVYNIQKDYVEGNNRFYFIANEESVGEVQFEPEITLPPNTDVSSLSTILDSDAFAEDTSDVEILETVLTSMYFTPQYEIVSTDDTPQDIASPVSTVYLPYSVCYTEEELADKREFYDQDGTLLGVEATMYLVPAATKFIFEFVNYRSHNVDISDITVSQTDTANFHFAQVGSTDYTKSYNNTDYYWVNWLARVAEASQQYPDYSDNAEFNTDYGWIGNYSIPTASTLVNSTFVSTTNKKTVPAGQTTVDENDLEMIIPGTLFLGPCYVPESFNPFTYQDENTGEDVSGQRYFLTLALHDVNTTPGLDPTFNNVAIGNVRALFRNTCVVIKVNMSEDDVEVYAEINPWNIKTANGWLVEGNAPSPNPF